MRRFESCRGHPRCPKTPPSAVTLRRGLRVCPGGHRGGPPAVGVRAGRGGSGPGGFAGRAAQGGSGPGQGPHSPASSDTDAKRGRKPPAAPSPGQTRKPVTRRRARSGVRRPWASRAGRDLANSAQTNGPSVFSHAPDPPPRTSPGFARLRHPIRQPPHASDLRKQKRTRGFATPSPPCANWGPDPRHPCDLRRNPRPFSAHRPVATVGETVRLARQLVVRQELAVAPRVVSGGSGSRAGRERPGPGATQGQACHARGVVWARPNIRRPGPPRERQPVVRDLISLARQRRSWSTTPAMAVTAVRAAAARWTQSLDGRRRRTLRLFSGRAIQPQPPRLDRSGTATPRPPPRWAGASA